jgi:hypothetical protein
MEIGPFQIESEDEANSYLRDLLARPEYRSMVEVEHRAATYIRDPKLVDYFTSKAAEMLAAEPH